MHRKKPSLDLVGVQSDKILYPQSGGCGSLIWWKAEAPKYSYDCGMGLDKDLGKEFNMSKRESVKKRALMALLVAGGMLGSAPGGYAAPKAGAVSKSQLELVKTIAENQKISSELRAYYLIQIARSALQGMDGGALEKQYDHMLMLTPTTFFLAEKTRSIARYLLWPASYL
ncbi:MAG: hypothetical protein R3D26_08800 [Cyanobacteriota/Melainabacteria group bacterium]